MKEELKKIYAFLNMYCKENIKKYKSGDLDYIDINCEELLEYDPELLEQFIHNSQEMLIILDEAFKLFGNATEGYTFKYKFINLSNYSAISLSHIRTQDLNKLVSVSGMIKRKSTSMIKVISLDYICTNISCSYSENIISLPQNEEKERTLKVCPKCKSGVELISKKQTDYQQLYLEENNDDLNNSSILPENKLIEVMGYLTEPLNNEKFLVGSKVEIIGVIKEKVKTIGNGGNSILSTSYLEALNIISLEEDISTIEITKEDIVKFKELANKENIFQILCNSIAPSIAGRDFIKEGTLLYVVGGSKVEANRDLINILTIGNPSTGKSVMLKRLKKLLPRAVYISAENATGAGMIGAAVNDKMTGSWTIEAGAMVMANNGYFLIDEFDKASKSDQDHLHQGLEHSEVTINKAGILANLKTYCPVYAVANPKLSKFDENQDYAKQLTFKTSLLSRFDLIYIIDSRDTEKEHKEIMQRILRRKGNQGKEVLDDEILRKYLMYCKKLNPVIEDKLLDKLEEYFDSVYRKSKELNTIEIGYRQLAGLIRLSQAYAKLHLREKVLESDVIKAISLMSHCLSKFGVSEIESGMSNKTRESLRTIEAVITDLNESQGSFTFEEVRDRLKDTNIDIAKRIAQLKQEGIIFEPRRNVYKLVG